jgi:hypothetical protein
LILSYLFDYVADSARPGQLCGSAIKAMQYVLVDFMQTSTGNSKAFVAEVCHDYLSLASVRPAAYFAEKQSTCGILKTTYDFAIVYPDLKNHYL